MSSRIARTVRIAAFAVLVPMLAAAALGRAQDAPSTQVTPTNTVPNATVDSSAKVSKDSRKSEKKQQKHEENAANARARQAKADAKAKKQADKAQQQSAKAQDESKKASSPQ